MMIAFSIATPFAGPAEAPHTPKRPMPTAAVANEMIVFILCLLRDLQAAAMRRKRAVSSRQFTGFIIAPK
jgi:hypothetical protein